jgi:hypothetical protein
LCFGRIFNIKKWTYKQKIINQQQETANLQTEVAARDAKIANIYQFLSWKITVPLRAVDRWLRVRS